jgi:hypothetical protein
MAQIIVEVTEGTAASLAKLVRERMSAENGANTHGKLDVPRITRHAGRGRGNGDGTAG